MVDEGRTGNGKDGMRGSLRCAAHDEAVNASVEMTEFGVRGSEARTIEGD